MVIKQRNLLTNIIFWIAMVFMAYFAENVVVFDLGDFQRGFSLLEYILLFVGIVFILGYYFYNERKFNGLRIRWLLVAFLLLIVVGAAIGIFSTPEIQYFETIEIIDEVETVVVKEYVTVFSEKIKSFLFVLIAAVGVYIQLLIFPRMVSFKKYVLFIMYIIVTVSIISAFLSFVLDFDSYVHLYYHGLIGYVRPKSFLFNKNMYGLILLLGMLALYVIISFLPKWYNYVFLVFLFVNAFFTFSKAAFGIALITFIVHFVYRMIVTFRKNKARNIVFLVLVGISGICGILLIPFPFFMDVQLFNNARRFVLEYYVELGIGSYDGRTEIWESVLSLSTGIHLWFGRGLSLFNSTLYFHTGEINVSRAENYFSHNGFLEILGQYGLFGFVPYCLAVLTVLIIDIYVAVKKYEIGIPALIIFGAFLGYTMVETSTLFDLTIEGVTTTALVTLPSFSWLYARRHQEANKEIFIAAENIEYVMPKSDKIRFEKRASYICALVLAAFTLYSFFILFQKNASNIDYVILILLVLTIFVCLPRTLGNIYNLKIMNRLKAFWVSLVFAFLFCLGSLFLMIIKRSIFSLFIGIQLVLSYLLISEHFFGKDKASFKDYLVKRFGRASILFVSILIIVLPIIFLFPDLNLFILSELTSLIIIIATPLISNLDPIKNTANKLMLLACARNIGG